MALTTEQTRPLVAFTLPSSPHSARMARFYVHAALSYHHLDSYAEDAETVASELITNAITHAGPLSVGLELTYQQDARALAVIVTDSSPVPPIKRTPPVEAEHGRGLNIVEALSAQWGWQPQDPGKAVYAILTREA